MRLYLIYEILFHRPSGAYSFLFQSLRVVSLHEAVLTTQQLTALKRLIITTFINQYLDKSYLLDVEGEHLDALMTLNMFVGEQSVTSKAQVTSPAS
jgi:hypothetical protein